MGIFTVVVNFPNSFMSQSFHFQSEDKLFTAPQVFQYITSLMRGFAIKLMLKHSLTISPLSL